MIHKPFSGLFETEYFFLCKGKSLRVITLLFLQNYCDHYLHVPTNFHNFYIKIPLKAFSKISCHFSHTSRSSMVVPSSSSIAFPVLENISQSFLNSFLSFSIFAKEANLNPQFAALKPFKITS